MPEAGQIRHGRTSFGRLRNRWFRCRWMWVQRYGFGHLLSGGQQDIYFGCRRKSRPRYRRTIPQRCPFAGNGAGKLMRVMASAWVFVIAGAGLVPRPGSGLKENDVKYNACTGLAWLMLFAAPAMAEGPNLQFGSDTRKMSNQECLDRAKFAMGEKG